MIFREKWGKRKEEGRERGKKTHQCEREMSIGCLPYSPTCSLLVYRTLTTEPPNQGSNVPFLWKPSWVEFLYLKAVNKILTFIFAAVVVFP